MPHLIWDDVRFFIFPHITFTPACYAPGFEFFFFFDMNRYDIIWRMGYGNGCFLTITQQDMNIWHDLFDSSR